MARPIDTANLYLDMRDMRAVAAALGVSVWTVHRDLHRDLPRVDHELHLRVGTGVDGVDIR